MKKRSYTVYVNDVVVPFEIDACCIWHAAIHVLQAATINDIISVRLSPHDLIDYRKTNTGLVINHPYIRRFPLGERPL